MSETASAAAGGQAPLSEVMLAMDVVDTLRHRQDLVEKELNGAARDAALLEKLRDIYRQQGIDVPDSVLSEGVKALKESRFTYVPPKPSLSTSLARLYVSRKRWGAAAIGVLLALIIGLSAYLLVWQPYQSAQAEAARIELTDTLPHQMDALYQAIYEETKVQQAVTMADTLIAKGKAAASKGDKVGAQKAIADLTAIRDQLRLEYKLQIVTRTGEKSGFWRIPQLNTAATNYYLVVEAVDKDGQTLKLPITNEETGKTETVSMWGVRVPESAYRSVEADKRDDGIIERNVVGVKEYGFLDTDWTMPVLGGAVTKW